MLIVGFYFACKVLFLLLGAVSGLLVAMRDDRERSDEVAKIVEDFLRKNEIKPL
jgi:hypothetical protein